MIIFINGSINSGKTTIAGILEKRLPRVAIIEVDSLRDMIKWMPLDEAIPINLENTVSLVKNFTKSNLNTIVVYPIRKENHDYLMNNLKDLNEKIYIFTLSPKREKVLTNRGRELSSWEIESIKNNYDVGIPNPSFGEIIDNTNNTPDETADFILSRLS